MHRFNGGYNVAYSGLESFSDEDKVALFLLANKAAARFAHEAGGTITVAVDVRPVANAWGVRTQVSDEGREVAVSFSLDTDARRALFNALEDVEAAVLHAQ